MNRSTSTITLKQPTSQQRLLFITAEPHPTFRADVRVLFGKYLARLGVLTDLFTYPLSDSASTEPWAAGRLLLSSVPRNRWHKQWAVFWHDLSLFARVGDGYSAVQVRDRVIAGCIALAAARWAGIPFIYWASYPKPEMRLAVAAAQGWKRDPIRWLINRCRGALSLALLYRLVLPKADHVFVQSEEMLKAFAERGINRANMTPIPMGVDIEACVELGTVPSALEERIRGRRVVIYAGALDSVRQPGLMIEVMTRVREACAEAHLLLVGESPDETDMQALRSQVATLGLQECVTFAGWQAPSVTFALLARAEVGLSLIPRGPLYDVSSPTKIAEYFAFGLPVVANDLPDQRLVMKQSGAGECVSLDPQEVASAVVRLLLDRDEARRMGAAGREYIGRNRSYASLAQSVATVYRGKLKLPSSA